MVTAKNKILESKEKIKKNRGLKDEQLWRISEDYDKE